MRFSQRHLISDPVACLLLFRPCGCSGIGLVFVLLPSRRFSEAMSLWCSWRSRIFGPSLLLLLTTSGIAFLLGLLTFSFISELLHLSSDVFSPLFLVDQQQQKSDIALSSSPHRFLPADFISFKENCSVAKHVAAEKVRSFVLESVFDGVSPFEDFPSPETAPLLRKKRIKGWGADASVFERLMKEVRPSVIVELGTFLGASAIHMGTVARNLGLRPVILCVDDFRGWPGFRATKFHDIKLLNGNNMLYYQFMKNIQFVNLTDLILPVPFSTTGALLNFCEWGIRPDLIEIDAAHDFHSAWLDLNLAYPCLRSGGVMFGHDYFNRANSAGVRRAVDLFAKLKYLKVEPDGKHWILRNSSFISAPATAATATTIEAEYEAKRAATAP